MNHHAGATTPAVSARAGWVRQALRHLVPDGTALVARLVVALAGLPLPIRRFALRIGTELLWIGGLQPDPAIVVAQRHALAWPRARGISLARRTIHQSYKYTLESFALVRRSVPQLIRDGRFISTSGEREIEWIAAQPGAGIATMHFGPYTIGLAWLLQKHFQGRRVVVLKSANSSSEEQRAIGRIAELGVELHMMAPERKDEFHQLLRFVRGGGIAITMVDLPREYGKTMVSNALRLPMEFSNGAPDLAAICGVPLMLCRFRSRGLRDVVEVEGLFDMDRRRPDTIERARRGIRTAVTRVMRDDPDQWHMWPMFQRYLPLRAEGVA